MAKWTKKQWETDVMNVMQAVVTPSMVSDYHDEINTPGRRTLAAASSLLLFKMSTSSPTVLLVVPQSRSSSIVGLLPWTTRPSNLLWNKQTDTFLSSVASQHLAISPATVQTRTSRDAESTWSPRSASVSTPWHPSTCLEGPGNRTPCEVNCSWGCGCK